MAMVIPIYSMHMRAGIFFCFIHCAFPEPKLCMAYSRHPINICLMTVHIPVLEMRTPGLERWDNMPQVNQHESHQAPADMTPGVGTDFLHLLSPGHLIILKAATLPKLRTCFGKTKPSFGWDCLMEK